MCVQRFDDSLNSAIHTTYRISLRSSSMREPRDPLLKVLTFLIETIQTDIIESNGLMNTSRGCSPKSGSHPHRRRPKPTPHGSNR
jgi:hypothetical protein